MCVCVCVRSVFGARAVNSSDIAEESHGAALERCEIWWQDENDIPDRVLKMTVRGERDTR